MDRRLPRWRSLLVCVATLVLLSGCLAGPLIGQQRPATIVLHNSANTTHTYEVAVVELPATIYTKRDDGETGDYPIGEGVGSHHSGDYHILTEVELPDSARTHGRYSIAPGEENRTTIENFPRRFAVIVVVYRAENEIISWVSANCDDAALTGLNVTSLSDPPGGVTLAHSCM